MHNLLKLLAKFLNRKNFPNRNLTYQWDRLWLCFLVHSFHGEWLHFCGARQISGVQPNPSTSPAPEFFFLRVNFPHHLLQLLKRFIPKIVGRILFSRYAVFVPMSNRSFAVRLAPRSGESRSPRGGLLFAVCLRFWTILSSVVDSNNVESLLFGRSVGELVSPGLTSRKTNSPHFATDYTTKEIF